MTEDEIREIVREELGRYFEEARIAQAAADDQWLARHDEEWDARLAPDPNDGPGMAKMKAAMRGETQS